MDTRKHIFEKYNLSPAAQIGRGMEAEVYAYGDNTVLKIYAGTATVADLTILKDFYSSLERNLVHYNLPNIYSVTQEYDHVVTVEQRLMGQPMATVLEHLSTKDLDAAMQEYLTAVLALANINAPADRPRLKLFDPQQLSQVPDGDWHHFLRSYLKYKLLQLTPYLERDVANFSAKLTQLNTLLAAPYEGAYTLIHGDFFPGNLLIDDQHRATALIDFGLFTMYGDHMFDVATSWVFFDMYDDLKANIYDRFQAILLATIGDDKRGILYRYILIYSILAANTFSADCTDGQYQWCVANLNNPHYWKHLA